MISINARSDATARQAPYQFPLSALRTRFGSDAWDEFFRRLRELEIACGTETNKHDKVITLIAACIDDGIDTSANITSVLVSLGYNAQHVRIQLRHHTGDNPQRHYWTRDGSGVYRNLQ